MRDAEKTILPSNSQIIFISFLPFAGTHFNHYISRHLRAHTSPPRNAYTRTCRHTCMQVRRRWRQVREEYGDTRESSIQRLFKHSHLETGSRNKSIKGSIQVEMGKYCHQPSLDILDSGAHLSARVAKISRPPPHYTQFRFESLEYLTTIAPGRSICCCQWH